MSYRSREPRRHRIVVRLGDSEMEHLRKVMEKTGLRNISETVRFLINMNKLHMEGVTAIYPNPEALLSWFEEQGLIIITNKFKRSRG